MTDVTQLVCELLDLLLDDSSRTNTTQCAKTQHSRSSSYDKCAQLDTLLAPYMSYAIKTALLPKTLSATTSAPNKMAVAFVKANMACESAALYATDLVVTVAAALAAGEVKTRDWTVRYRRLTRSRLQSCCTVPVPGMEPLDFMWESSAIAGPCNWTLRRLTFNESDDEEHYWRPWEPTCEEAEEEYNAWYAQDFRGDLASLDVSELDWDSASNSSSSSKSSKSASPDSASSLYSWSTTSTALTKVNSSTFSPFNFSMPAVAATKKKEYISYSTTTTTAKYNYEHVPRRALVYDDEEEDEMFGVTVAPVTYGVPVASMDCEGEDEAEYWNRYGDEY